MSATGTLDMNVYAEGKAGNPGIVMTINDGKDAPGATALGVDKPKDDKPKTKTRLPLPTSIVEENKIKKQQQRKQKPPNINITNSTNVENKTNEENKIKQPSINEFVKFTKKKIEEKEQKEMEDNQFPSKILVRKRFWRDKHCEIIQ